MEGGIKCFSTAARFSSSILVTFPWNKCLLLGFLVWEELKGGWEISVPFWDVGICSYREKIRETFKGPAEKVFSDMLWRGFVAVSVHSYICSVWCESYIFWWNRFKAFCFSNPPWTWWLHFQKWSQRKSAVQPMTRLQHFIYRWFQ